MFCYSRTNEIGTCIMFFYHVTIENTTIVGKLKILIEKDILEPISKRIEQNLSLKTYYADHALFKLKYSYFRDHFVSHLIFSS